VAHDVVERILRFDTGPGRGRDVGGLVWEE